MSTENVFFFFFLSYTLKVTCEKKSKHFFFFVITALKIGCDSRLDEHEAFLQLPCRLM